jgi:hypothetical protein
MGVDEGRREIFAKPSLVKGHDETINVPALKITLPLKSVYARLGPR